MDTLCLWATPLEPDKVNGEVVVIMARFSEGNISLPPVQVSWQAVLEPKARVWLNAAPFELALGWRCA